ncbi:hypothetical protein QTN25_006494 [Entamoeba marina]
MSAIGDFSGYCFGKHTTQFYKLYPYTPAVDHSLDQNMLKTPSKILAQSQIEKNKSELSKIEAKREDSSMQEDVISGINAVDNKIETSEQPQMKITPVSVVKEPKPRVSMVQPLGHSQPVVSNKISVHRFGDDTQQTQSIPKPRNSLAPGFGDVGNIKQVPQFSISSGVKRPKESIFAKDENAIKKTVGGIFKNESVNDEQSANNSFVSPLTTNTNTAGGFMFSTSLKPIQIQEPTTSGFNFDSLKKMNASTEKTQPQSKFNESKENVESDMVEEIVKESDLTPLKSLYKPKSKHADKHKLTFGEVPEISEPVIEEEEEEESEPKTQPKKEVTTNNSGLKQEGLPFTFDIQLKKKEDVQPTISGGFNFNLSKPSTEEKENDKPSNPFAKFVSNTSNIFGSSSLNSLGTSGSLGSSDLGGFGSLGSGSLGTSGSLGASISKPSTEEKESDKLSNPFANLMTNSSNVFGSNSLGSLGTSGSLGSGSLGTSGSLGASISKPSTEEKESDKLSNPFANLMPNSSNVFGSNSFNSLGSTGSGSFGLMETSTSKSSTEEKESDKSSNPFANLMSKSNEPLGSNSFGLGAFGSGTSLFSQNFSSGENAGGNADEDDQVPENEEANKKDYTVNPMKVLEPQPENDNVETLIDTTVKIARYQDVGDKTKEPKEVKYSWVPLSKEAKLVIIKRKDSGAYTLSAMNNITFTKYVVVTLNKKLTTMKEASKGKKIVQFSCYEMEEEKPVHKSYTFVFETEESFEKFKEIMQNL